MKVEYKSMFLGVALGVVGVFAILFLLGDVETEFSFSTGENENKMDKNIDVRIEKTVENGQDFTNVVVKGSGDVTKEDLDKELERLFNEHGINKNDSNINIEMEINS
ncbi:MAG: hypothetical protein VX651_07765 [Candidatus Neomarinimicrobiota bacterium]|jgi:hypothetical protein|nr:hypothetical protein [Candidatus Neomarinimicrobiota bacterium]|tara:strand:+ start:317 stop:637 length:321 start_codon:yes stop_codon:yes gene_type:complete